MEIPIKIYTFTSDGLGSRAVLSSQASRSFITSLSIPANACTTRCFAQYLKRQCTFLIQHKQVCVKPFRYVYDDF